jgi:plastocyanin
MKQLVTGVLISFAMFAAQANSAFAIEEFSLSIKDHKFTPDEITIPANTKVKLTVKNLDPTPEEFESEKLHREKVIQGNSQAVIFIGPLAPGSYPFIGEFHKDTAKGHINVK